MCPPGESLCKVCDFSLYLTCNHFLQLCYFIRVNGCYESLDGGNLSDALVDFTSGISETMDISSGGYSSDEEKRKDLFKMLLKHKDNYALMCCAVAVTMV